MKKKEINNSIIVFIILLFFFNLSFAQKRERLKELSKQQPVYVESHIIPSDTSYLCFLSYKVPYNNLLFVKEKNRYTTGYSIVFEIFEKDKFIKRVYGNESILTNSYENTLSENLFLEGLVSFEIKKGNYHIKPAILLKNTDVEAKIKPINITVDSTEIYKPIFVKEKMPICEGGKYQLENLQNSIPFSDRKVDMLIPYYSSNEESITVELKQDDKTVVSKELINFEKLNAELSKCGNQIILTDRRDIKLIKFIKINFVNQKLVEGTVDIIIKIDKKEMLFEAPVLWNNKPKSLKDTETALDYLEIIGLDDVADSIYSLPAHKEYQALFNFWKNFDDDTTTAFNSVFDEFYSRIDYAQKHFNSVGKHDGIETDRGKIYILYGKPDKIERAYSDVYNIIEIWDYESINKKFYFSDKTGTGNFERMK